MRLFGRALRQYLTAALVLAGALAGTAAPAAANANNYAALIIDANTGAVLYSRNADAMRYPASLTKMMTLYLLFEDLENGKVSLNSRLSVSANAANQAPTRLGLTPGSTIRVEDAILAMVTKSANDVAMVVAENLAASAEAFAQRMTETARALGMNSTTFRNPHGLPDSRQVTTARDMAVLGQALHDRFPQYFDYFSAESFTWNGVTYRNHNNLLGDAGIQGIKTGYTNASGYNLVISYERNGRYVVAVVMGGDTAAQRDQDMRNLLAQYVPRASAGPRTAPLVVASPLDLLPVPLPRANPVRTDPIVTAAIAPTAPAAPPITPPAPIVPAAQGDFDPAQAVPVPPPIGWIIQVGALDNEALAQQRLNRALELEGQLLAGLLPYTETVQSGGTTLYRARFMGFANRDAAAAACTRMAAHGIECYVPAL